MSDISDRINKIADYYNLKTYAEFAKKTGLSHQTVSNYMKGKQKPDIEKLAIIKQTFDNINTEWLLTGKGNMINPTNDFSTIELINHLLDNKDELIQNETFRDYIRMVMELIMVDDEREKKNKALEKLRGITLEKHKKKTNL